VSAAQCLSHLLFAVVSNLPPPRSIFLKDKTGNSNVATILTEMDETSHAKAQKEYESDVSDLLNTFSNNEIKSRALVTNRQEGVLSHAKALEDNATTMNDTFLSTIDKSAQLAVGEQATFVFDEDATFDAIEAFSDDEAEADEEVDQEAALANAMFADEDAEQNCDDG
jgi:hypothetical protein